MITKCKREGCGGSVLPNDEGVPQCSMCGRTGTEVADMPKVQRGRRHTFEQYLTLLEPQKDAFLADLQVLGITATLEKYHINNRVWPRLRDHWGIHIKAGRKAGQVDKEPRKKKLIKPGIPQLPIFKDAWPMETQCKWLDIWLQLYKMEKKDADKGGEQ